jgi:hypothetical protein
MPFILDHTPPAASAIGGTLAGFFQTKQALDQQRREEERQDTALALESQKVQAEILRAQETASLNRQIAEQRAQLGNRELGLRERGIEADLEIAKRRYPDAVIAAQERQADFQRRVQEGQMAAGVIGLGAMGTLAGGKAAGNAMAGQLGRAALPDPETFLSVDDYATFQELGDEVSRQAFAQAKYVRALEEEHRQVQSRVDRWMAENPKGESGRPYFDAQTLKLAQDAVKDGQYHAAEGILKGAIAEFGIEEAFVLEAQSYLEEGRALIRTPGGIEDMDKVIIPDESGFGGITRRQRIGQLMSTLASVTVFGPDEEDTSVAALGEELLSLAKGKDYEVYKQERAQRELDRQEAALSAQQDRERQFMAEQFPVAGPAVRMGREIRQKLMDRAVPMSQWARRHGSKFGVDNALWAMYRARLDQGQAAANDMALQAGLHPEDPELKAALEAIHAQVSGQEMERERRESKPGAKDYVAPGNFRDAVRKTLRQILGEPLKSAPSAPAFKPRYPGFG